MSIKLKELWDEQHEVMAWVILALAVLGRLFDKLGDWPTASVAAFALLTMLGTARFRGVSIGPGGVSVDRNDSE